MRRTALALLLPLTLVACEDAIGVGSGCAAEMRDVRRQLGPPDSSDRQRRGGDISEQWTYFDERQVYTFRWGTSYERCSVSSARFSWSTPDD